MSLPRWFSAIPSEAEDRRVRVVARQRLGLVVEIDEERLGEAGLDEAVGVAVERAASGWPARKDSMFATRTSPSKWVTDPAFEAGTSAASPSTKMFGLHGGLQRCVVGRDEPELVAEAG